MFFSLLINSFVVSILLSIVFAVLGIFVLLKKMSFFSDGLAHAAILGLAISFLLNLNLLIFTLLSSVIFALLIYILERKTRLHTDSLIGLIFVSSLSLGLILMSQKPGYQPELLNFLIGNVLTITRTDLYLTIVFSFLILTIVLSRFRNFFLISLDPVEAKLRGINIRLYEILLYVLLAISVILGIKLVGIVLVTSFLILPPITASLISNSLKNFIFLSILLSILNVVSGFLLAYTYNLPIGPSIVVFGSLIFFLIFLLKILFKNELGGI